MANGEGRLNNTIDVRPPRLARAVDESNKRQRRQASEL